MAAFEFRLERVLRWRATQLGLEQMRLIQAVAEMKKSEADLAKIEQERVDSGRDLLASGAIAGWSLAALAGYRDSLARQADRMRRQRAEQESRVAAQRQTVLEAQRRCELLERLKARRREEARQQERREIESSAGELHLAQWSARARGEAARGGSESLPEPGSTGTL
jgi:flagellar export protein FliJ